MMVERSPYQVRLDSYRILAERCYVGFEGGYKNREGRQRLKQNLPMMVRAWQIVFIEAKQNVVAITYLPGVYNPAAFAFDVVTAEDETELANKDNIDDIVEVARIGDVIDFRAYPFITDAATLSPHSYAQSLALS